MKVCILHRPTAVPGGDLLTVVAYAAALRRYDVDVETRSATALDGLDKFDFIHLWAACSPDWGLPAARAAKAAGKPLIITPSWWRRNERQTFYGRSGEDIAEGYTPAVAETLRLADVLFTCTMSEAVECWRTAGRLIPTMCRMMGHDPLEIERQKPEDYVLCLGRIEPHKNQFELTLACKQLGYRLVLAGSLVEPHEYYSMLCKRDGAEIRPHLDHEAAMQLLARARVHALPSFSETPGLANMEAVMLGVPAVMGWIGAEPEFFGEWGMYCDPASLESIKYALQVAWETKRIAPMIVQSWDEIAEGAAKWMQKRLS